LPAPQDLGERRVAAKDYRTRARAIFIDIQFICINLKFVLKQREMHAFFEFLF